MTSSNAAPSLEGFVKSALHRSWWLLLLRGIAAVAFGVLTFVWPQISLLTLIMVCLLYTSPSPRDLSTSRMPSSA